MSDSAIIRVHKKSSNFSVTDNTSAQDESLSAEATGAIAYLLTKPNDWQVITGDIRRRFGFGREKCRNVLRELERSGYLLRFRRNIGGTGRFRWESHLFENPEMANMVEVQIKRPKPKVIKQTIPAAEGRQEVVIVDPRESPHYQETTIEPTQRQKMVAWLRSNEVPMPDTEKEWSYLESDAAIAYLSGAERFPGWRNIGILATEYAHMRIGAPAIHKAANLWSTHGHSMNNMAGIMEWAEELERDITWKPYQKRKKHNEHKSTGHQGNSTQVSTGENSEAAEWWRAGQRET